MDDRFAQLGYTGFLASLIWIARFPVSVAV